MKRECAEYDVIVAGAGPSGLTAALAAARMGCQVLLLEKNGCVGGVNTTALVGPLMTFHSGATQVVKGIAQEIVDRLALRKATLGHIPDPIGMVSTITPVDPEQLKLVYFEMLRQEPNIKLLLNATVTGVQIHQGTITGLEITGKAKRRVVAAPLVIDATGDGDVAAMAGEEFLFGRDADGYAQPMSLMFRVGGVDIPRVVSYVKENPAEFVFTPHCDLNDYLAVSGFFSQVQKAKQAGVLDIPRDRVLFFQTMQPGEILVNMSRIIKQQGTSLNQLTDATIQGYAQVDQILAFFRNYLPGFSSCTLHSIAPNLGVRESRRIVGKKTLTLEDVLGSASQKDSVAVCGYPVDIHDPTGANLETTHETQPCYDLSYGIMLPQKTNNLLVTGRCISASHEALASARITAAAMALGQAAGQAAALCIQHTLGPAELPVPLLQKELEAAGAIPGKKWLTQMP